MIKMITIKTITTIKYEHNVSCQCFEVGVVLKIPKRLQVECTRSIVKVFL